MDLFLLNGEADDLSLQDMIEKDMKSEYGMSTFDDFHSDFSLNTFDSDVCMRTLEPLFDCLPGIDMDSPSAATPAASSSHSSCSSSSSLDDDQGRLAMEHGINDIAWLSSSSSSRDMTFDLDTAVMVNPSTILPPNRLHTTTRGGGALYCDVSVTTTNSPPSPSAGSNTIINTTCSNGNGAASATFPMMTSQSPLLSSSPVLLTSNASTSTNNDASSLQTGSLSVATTAGTTFINTSSNTVTSNSTQTLYIKTEPLHNSLSPSSTVQLSQGSTGVNSTQVAVLRPSTTNTLVANNAANNSSTSTVVMSPTMLAGTPRQISQQHATAIPQQHRLQITASASSISSNTNRQTTANIVAHSNTRISQHNHQLVNGSSPLTTVHTNNNQHIFRGKPSTIRTTGGRRTDERALPKPAYSYSCLIALALKNSTTGSLPVSEIYSFMCEYFPYFRTAPNGWKNSVRHNLSLNKCFEKIEKPVVAGNNQRKGCLWALNPSKMHKMDEEIQKWSKKDLQGIRDAMNNPDVLTSLERGEMKFEAASSLSSCSEDEDEDEEVDALTLTEPPTTLTTLKLVSSNGHLSPRTAVVGQVIQQPQQRTTLQIHTSKSLQQPAILRQTGNQQQLVTNKIRASAVFTASAVTNNSPTRQEPEFILPDSTMTEISFQANGALVDDLGNEISIEEDVTTSNGISSSIASNVSVVSSPRNLVLRKLPVTPVRSPTLHTKYVYSPSVASPHQHNLNRLVLTNAKLTS